MSLKFLLILFTNDCPGARGVAKGSLDLPMASSSPEESEGSAYSAKRDERLV